MLVPYHVFLCCPLPIRAASWCNENKLVAAQDRPSRNLRSLTFSECAWYIPLVVLLVIGFLFFRILIHKPCRLSNPRLYLAYQTTMIAEMYVEVRNSDINKALKELKKKFIAKEF